LCGRGEGMGAMAKKRNQRESGILLSGRTHKHIMVLSASERGEKTGKKEVRFNLQLFKKRVSGNVRKALQKNKLILSKK